LEALEDRTAPALFSVGGLTVFVPDANAAPLTAALNHSATVTVQTASGVLNVSGTLTSVASTGTSTTAAFAPAALVTVQGAAGAVNVSGSVVGVQNPGLLAGASSPTTTTTTSSLGGLLDPIGSPVGG
jgi:hypothetical protein